MKEITVSAMRELDEKAIQDYGIPAMVLMENAGRGVANIAISSFPSSKSVLVICGGGNNGGDGLVAARHLHNHGINTTIVFIGSKEKLSPEAAANLNIVRKMKIKFVSPDDMVRTGRESDVIIDALFGIGLSRDVEGEAKRVIMDLNELGIPIISVDVPSGLNGDTGLPMGQSIKATITVALALAKSGLNVTGAREYVGDLKVLDISIPKELLDGSI